MPKKPIVTVKTPATSTDPRRAIRPTVNNATTNVEIAKVELVDPVQVPPEAIANSIVANITTNNFSNSVNIQTNNIYINSSPPGVAYAIAPGTPEIVNVIHPLPTVDNAIVSTSKAAVSVNKTVVHTIEPAVTTVTPTAITSGPYGNQEYINIGAVPNDGTGDPLRVAFNKINNNFSNLFSTTVNTTVSYTPDNVADQVIFEVPITEFTQGTFQIRSSDIGTVDSQSVTISAQITNNSDDVKYTAYGTMFSGNALTRYNMDVFSSNVRLMVSPIVNHTLLHFISSQITYIDQGNISLTYTGLDGYPVGSVLGTEDGLILTIDPI